MKKSVLLAAAAMMSVSAMAQQRPQAPLPNYKFTTVDSVAITPVKNQKNAGTCWCYSGMGMLEAELLRTKGKVYDLSEMYVVFQTYMDRAEKAVRTSGDVSFSQGGSTYDVTYAIDHFGLVPDVEMPAGVMYGETLSNHSELTALGNPLIAAAVKARKPQVSPDGEPLWKKAVRAVHEVYLGKCPEKFTFEGKEYTPKSFAQSLGLKSDDYVSLTSFSHEPYSTGANKGKGFAIEVQDNWRWAQSINMELDDFCQVFDDAIKAGYTVLWASDVSEATFSRQGVGSWDVEEKVEDNVSIDELRLVGGDTNKAVAVKANNKEVLPKPQKKVTVAERQAMYDTKSTTDDHGMLIFGIAKDQWGNKYYMVKNSWGESGNYKGIYYVTPEFVRAKTMNVTVNKAAVSKNFRDKYGF